MKSGRGGNFAPCFNTIALTFWLRKAATEKGIGILFRDKVIAIRPISRDFPFDLMFTVFKWLFPAFS